MPRPPVIHVDNGIADLRPAAYEAMCNGATTRLVVLPMCRTPPRLSTKFSLATRVVGRALDIDPPTLHAHLTHRVLAQRSSDGLLHPQFSSLTFSLASRRLQRGFGQRIHQHDHLLSTSSTVYGNRRLAGRVRHRRADSRSCRNERPRRWGQQKQTDVVDLCRTHCAVDVARSRCALRRAFASPIHGRSFMPCWCWAEATP